jgi:hypothetical protein
MFIWHRLKIFFLPLFVLLSINAMAQSAPQRMGAIVEISYARFDPELNFNSGAGLGGGLFYAITPGLQVELDGHRNGSSREFDLIGGRDELELSLGSFLLKLHAAVLQLPGEIALSLSGGIGVLRLERKAHTISLGALGQRSLPAESEMHALYSLGASFGRNISSRFFIRLAPEAQFVSISGMKTNFYIKGGLGIVFF